MLVQFTKPYTRPGEARARRPGELVELPQPEADVLISQSIAKEHRIGPTETKEET